MTSRMLSSPQKMAARRSMPDGEAPVGRRPVAEGVEQEAEAGLGRLLRDAEHGEDASLDIGAVDTDAPRAELPAVEHEVVRLGSHGQRIGLEQVEVVGVRHGERVVGRDGIAGVVHAVEHREVDDPHVVAADPPRHVGHRARCAAPRGRYRPRRVRSATTRTRSPGSAPLVSMSPPRSSSLKNRSSGESKATEPPGTPGPDPSGALPSPGTTRNQASPLAPSPFALSTRESRRERASPPSPGTTIALTQGAAKARTPVPANTPERSTSSIPKRRSGLSVPNRSRASDQVMVVGGEGAWPVPARVASCTASETKPITSSCATKEASRSSWVNSNCRSARGSSSRMQRAIWKYRSNPPTMSSCLASWGLWGNT